MESKQHMTRPFCMSTCGGGCAYLHSSSEREHLLRANSRHTSSVNHRESLPPPLPPPTAGGAPSTSGTSGALGPAAAAALTRAMALRWAASTCACVVAASWLDYDVTCLTSRCPALNGAYDNFDACKKRTNTSLDSTSVSTSKQIYVA